MPSSRMSCMTTLAILVVALPLAASFAGVLPGSVLLRRALTRPAARNPAPLRMVIWDDIEMPPRWSALSMAGSESAAGAHTSKRWPAQHTSTRAPPPRVCSGGRYGGYSKQGPLHHARHVTGCHVNSVSDLASNPSSSTNQNKIMKTND